MGIKCQFYKDGSVFQRELANSIPIFNDIYIKTADCLASINPQQTKTPISFFDLQNHIEALDERSDFIKGNFSDVVLLGLGGSSLGAQTLLGLIRSDFKSIEGHPKIHFPDNLSSFMMEHLLEGLNLKKTHFIVISKSGETAETLAQFLVCLEQIKEQQSQENWEKHFTIISQKGENSLNKIAENFEFQKLEHPNNLGGRFSVFSVVGLLPASVGGLDIQEINKGAKTALKNIFDESSDLNRDLLLGTSLSYFLNQSENKNISFFMPYDSRLISFSKWYQQLVAESLGKKGKGFTPVVALGPLDQHSQLQLLLEGPDDKIITLLTEEIDTKGPKISISLPGCEKLDYLDNKTIGDLVLAEAHSTISVLVEKSRPLRHISYEKLTPEVLGELMMFFMVETVLLADLFNVNPFNQPAVERGKILTERVLRGEIV